MNVIRGSIRGLLDAAEASPSFSGACETAAGALRDAFDLVILHNQAPRGGDAPAGVLNPLVVMLAASAWERLVYELAAPAGISLRDRGTVGQLGGKDAQRTLQILGAASNGALPGALRVTVYERASGIRLGSPRKLDASNQADLEAICEVFDEYRELRNGVAHRVVPQRMATGSMRTDAGRSLREEQQHLAGLTINTSVARCVLAAYLQLIDQTIANVLGAQRIPTTPRTRLPDEWFTDSVRRDAAQRPMEPGCLWGGMQVPRR